MVIFAIVHLVVNVTLGTWLASMFLLDPLLGLLQDRIKAYRVIDRIGLGTIPFILFAVLALTHLIVFLVIGLLWPFAILTLISSALLLHWSYVSYYCLQRYCLVIDRTPFTRKHPQFLARCTHLAFLSAAIAIAFCLKWYYVPILLVIQILYRYLCAEHAIRCCMRRYKFDRKTAIFAINNDV